MSDVTDTAFDSAVFLQMGSFSDEPPAAPPAPGAWDGVTLDTYSHDRNIATVAEAESRSGQVPGANANPLTAQYIGELAPNEKGGDESRRLGFTVHGLLSQPGDVDTYSFKAAAGTEVWLDIDRTGMGLDSVVELVTADGLIQALSNDSLAEEQAGEVAFASSGIDANPLRKQAVDFAATNASGLVKDFYSTNQRDAGLRVVLPGTPGQVGTYHVRVRSSNLGPNDTADKLWNDSFITSGRTSGSYQLQVRLRELDEIAGSSIEYSDIRFANTGITVAGNPLHSPLQGEVAEDDSTNDISADAQYIGNLLQTDRAVISLAGQLQAAPGTTLPDNVDWYRVDLNYDALESIPGVTTASQYFATMFDIDYADGLARANTSLHIYDSSGNLILRATDSNVSEDRPGPLQGTGLTDLSRGSVGGLDPLVGAVQLPVGTYLIAVSNGSQVPAELEQYLVANPVNPLFRLEPINSVRRIVDEHIEPLTPETRPTGAPPVVDNFIDLNVNAVPFQLGDVTLFVSLDSTPFGNGTQLFTVDPVTGALETFVGQFNGDVGDIGMRTNGQLFGFTTDLDDGARSDAGTGNYLRIDTGTAATVNLGDDGLATFHGDPLQPNIAIPSMDGIHFEAIGYTFDANGAPLGVAVGSRPGGLTSATRPLIDYFDNILYLFDPTTGTVFSSLANRTGGNVLVGPGTDVPPSGQIRTDVGTTSGGATAIVGAPASEFDSILGVTSRSIVDGERFRIADQLGVFYDFEMNSGPEMEVLQDPTVDFTLRDGDTFTIDATPYEFDTGSVIVVEAVNGAGIQDGSTLTITNSASPSVAQVFEFNNGVGSVASDRVEIRYSSAFSRDQIRQAIVNAVNGANFGVSAEFNPGSNRITLVGESQTVGIPERPSGIGIEGSPGSFSSSLLIPIEETFTAEEVSQAIANAVNLRNVGGVTAGNFGSYVNFSGAIAPGFSILESRGLIRDLNADGNITLDFPVPFLVDDTAEEIAVRIAAAINSARIGGVSATVDGKIVNLTGATLLSSDPPLLPGGTGPGGQVTGVAFLGNRLFAVSDRGGLFEVLNYTTPDGAITRYVSESANDLLGINFQGLAAGPRNAENGRYRDLLFATDDAGVVYAFDEFGRLQPIFSDGATQVSTGLGIAGQVNGLAFSNLDYNLWHSTTFEPANDGAGGTITAGHGVEAAFDGSRIGRDPLIPNESLWFGFESLASNNVPNLSPLEQPTNLSGTYDFPGGAHGAIETEPFSLAGYSPADQPVLYLNYFLESENTNWTLTNPMRDAARIYVGDDSGEWRLLATNNSTRLASTGELVEGLDSPFDVQELFDVPAAGAQNWRQIRVPLDAVAGLDNLRMRIEFSTAGSMNVGDPDTAGDELRAIPGNELRDGQTFEIDGDTIFEIESGYTLVVPSGAAIIDGDTFTVRNGAQGAPDVIFEFDNGNGPNGSGIVVPYTADQTASQIALTIQQLIVANQSAPTVITGVDIGREDNDRLATALNVGITGESVRVTATGSIGDNPSLTGADRGLDVDLIRMDLGLNGRVQIDVDAQQRNSPLDAALRVFDANGIELAFNDNFNGLDPFIEFVAPAPGTYYVGVSNSTNIAYDATEDASGIAPATGGIGPYDLTITVMESVAAHRDGNRLSLEGINDILIDPISPLIVDGQVGSGSPNTVFVHGGMSDNEVATAIRYALAARYAQNHVDAVRGYEHVVRVIGHSVSDSGPFGLTNTLDGDLFGEFTSATRSLRGQNNAFRGFFIDDIIIGFAERGEMATGAVQNTSFVTDPLADPFDIQVGPYQLEIRGATEYGQPLPFDPQTDAPRIQLDRSFDTNDR
ncbi:MAG: PPC domain-containing protein, partial [Planctomycetales bacterium]|nr:PPC domain-containing protein [Planctomycetales bacterium]